MPQVSTVKKFVKSIQTGQTDTTKALTLLCLERAAVAGHLAELETPGALEPLPAWVEDALRARGLGDGEIQHIKDWPSVPKDKVREALHQAVQDNRVVEFRWELHGGADSANTVDNLSGPADEPIRVTFQSPQKNVRVQNAWLPTLGEIKVDI
jgi:hypothetical protein